MFLGGIFFAFRAKGLCGDLPLLTKEHFAKDTRHAACLKVSAGSARGCYRNAARDWDISRHGSFCVPISISRALGVADEANWNWSMLSAAGFLLDGPNSARRLRLF